MDSGITNQTLDFIPTDRLPTNWLTVLGFSEGTVRSGELSHSLPERTLTRLRSELRMWSSNARTVNLAQARQSEVGATMSFADLKKAATSLPWNSLLRSLILAE